MFASRVFPGAPLVRATRRRTSALISDDLPTFDRPTSAISGAPSHGKSSAVAALRTKVASIFNSDVASAECGQTFAIPIRKSAIRNPQTEIRNLMSNGVVDNGAVDRFGLRRRQPARQRFGQRDLQDLIHRLDHVDVQ